jgi:hypothetical protein
MVLDPFGKMFDEPAQIVEPDDGGCISFQIVDLEGEAALVLEAVESDAAQKKRECIARPGRLKSADLIAVPASFVVGGAQGTGVPAQTEAAPSLARLVFETWPAKRLALHDRNTMRWNMAALNHRQAQSGLFGRSQGPMRGTHFPMQSHGLSMQYVCLSAN